MHPLLITMAMLALIATTALTAVRGSLHRDAMHAMVTRQLTFSREVRCELEEELYTLDILKQRSSEGGQSEEPRARSEQNKGRRKRRQILALPTRLSLPNAIKGKEPFRRLMADLMIALYGHHPFFQEVAGAEEKILDALEEQLQAAPSGGLVCGLRQMPRDPELLAGLPMGSDELQRIWSKMIRGSDLDGVESIACHISMKGDSKINVVMAPEPLLKALFPHGDDAAKIAALRDQLVDQFRANLEDDPEVDGTDVIEAIKMATASAEACEGVDGHFTYTLIGDAERVTIRVEDGSVQCTRTYRNPLN